MVRLAEACGQKIVKPAHTIKNHSDSPLFPCLPASDARNILVSPFSLAQITRKNPTGVLRLCEIIKPQGTEVDTPHLTDHLVGKLHIASRAFRAYRRLIEKPGERHDKKQQLDSKTIY